jgi:hypothetical protein
VDESLPGFSVRELSRGLHTAAVSSYIGTMQEAPPKSRHKLYGGIAASVALHVIIAVALFARLPAPQPTPPKEDTVSVEIVPPPEEQKPEEKKPEEKPQEQALNLKMPEEKPEEEKQPPAPPPEPPKQEAEKAGAKPPEPGASTEEKQAEEKPPEEKAEQAPPPPPPEKKAEAEQPPPPPAAPEPAKQETPPPPPPAEEKAAEQQNPPPSEQPSSQQPPADATADELAQGRPLPALRPVFAFGDEDKGPKVAPDGNASEEGEIAKTDDAEPTDTAASPEDTSEEATSETNADVAKDTDPAAPALPQEVAPPVLSAANADALASGEKASSDKGSTDGIQAGISSQPPAGAAKGEKPTPDKKAGGKPLKEAKRLFSLRDTSDDVAMTAMGGIPRSTRAGQLCATELREQLRHGSPAYQPEILPSYGLPQGNVLDIRNAAFRADSQWFDVRFRCEIDENATKVVSFGVEVGNAVPRSQWRARRFPEY